MVNQSVFSTIPVDGEDNPAYVPLDINGGIKSQFGDTKMEISALPPDKPNFPIKITAIEDEPVKEGTPIKTDDGVKLGTASTAAKPQTVVSKNLKPVLIGVGFLVAVVVISKYVIK